MFSLIILNYIEALGFGFLVDTVCNEGHGLNLENTVEALDPQPAIMVNKYIIKKCKTTTYLAGSKRSDSVERCEVKKGMKSTPGTGYHVPEILSH